MEAPPPIRVVLIEEQVMFRQVVANLLSLDESIELVGQVPDGPKSIALVREKKPDVVVVRINSLASRAKEDLRQIQAGSNPPKAIVLTAHDDLSLLWEAVGRGVSACVHQQASAPELIAAVRYAVHSPDGSSRTLAYTSASACHALENRPADRSQLTARQLEVLLLVAQGLSNRRVAQELGLSETTVKRHLAHIYDRLEVASRGSAVRRALSKGWLTPRDVAVRS